MGRFKTKWLSRPENLAALIDLPGRWIDRVRRRRSSKTIILDMDSSESPTYGEQEGSAYNGHFGCTCYHPLFVFNQFGDLERVLLRRGNHHSAKFWRRALLPVIARYRDLGSSRSSGAMPRSLRPSCSGSSNRRATGTRSDSRPTPCWSETSPTS